MTKKAIEGKEARNKLMAGIDLVADAVKCTLGPSARYVMLERPYGSPLIIKRSLQTPRKAEVTALQQQLFSHVNYVEKDLRYWITTSTQ